MTKNHTERCYVCGEADAQMKVIDPQADPETGYVDEINLCEECFDKVLNKFKDREIPYWLN